MPRPRSVLVLLATLALVFAVVQVVPRGAPDTGALQPQARRDDGLADATAGTGSLTPSAQREIDRVLSATAASYRKSARTNRSYDVRAQVRGAVQCAVFEGQRYCLGSGWTDATEQQVQSRTIAVAERARAGTGPVERTGDLSLNAELAQRARLSPRARARADRRELEAAARSVAKVWLLRHQVQGVALPAGFLAAHPEVATSGTSSRAAVATTTARTLTAQEKKRKQRAIGSCTRKQTAKGTDRAKAAKRCRRAYQQANTPTPPPPTPVPTPTPVATPTVAPSPVVPVTPATVTPVTTPPVTTAPVTSAPVTAPPTTVAPTTEKTYDQYPPIASVLDKTQVAEQTRNYWCGPTAMQMIAWGSAGVAQSQDYWAAKLGTTRSGTGIRSMVRVVNSYTGWGGTDHGGPYVTLDISSFSYDQWMLLMMKHVVDYRSPVVLHPVLLKKYYPYLDDNGSGHFQVGRGYDKKGAKADLLGYFEPWNQQRFDRSEPAISRVQWRNAYKSYRANQDHFQHNVGV